MWITDRLPCRHLLGEVVGASRHLPQDTGIGSPRLIHSLNAGCEFQGNQNICKAESVTTSVSAFELTSIRDRYVDLPGAIAAGCERMVHPSVDGRDDRERQRRFIGVMLAAPFLAAGGAVALVTSGMGAAVTMAAIFASFGLCWFIALLVAASGRIVLAGRASLVMGGLALCGLIAAAGGPASPVALLAVALVFEAWWIGASRRAAVWGALAAGSALLLAPLAANVLPLASAGAAAWHWLLPLAWAMTLVSRLGGLGNSAAKLEQVEPAACLEDMISIRIWSFVLTRTGS